MRGVGVGIGRTDVARGSTAAGRGWVWGWGNRAVGGRGSLKDAGRCEYCRSACCQCWWRSLGPAPRRRLLLPQGTRFAILHGEGTRPSVSIYNMRVRELGWGVACAALPCHCSAGACVTPLARF